LNHEGIVCVDSELSFTIMEKIEAVINLPSSPVSGDKHSEQKLLLKKSLERPVLSMADTSLLSHDVIHDNFHNIKINVNIIDEDCILEMYEVIEFFDGNEVEFAEKVSQEEEQDQSPAEVSISSAMSFLLFEHEPNELCICSDLVSSQAMMAYTERHSTST